MAKKGKALAAPVVRVPADREEAATMLAEYGRVGREIEHHEIDLNQELADVKQKYLAKSQALETQFKELFKGLQMYCDAHRAELTGNGRTKTVDFGTGKITWKWNPAKVSHPGSEAEQIVARIEEKIAELTKRGESGALFAAFLRVVTTLDKDAIRKNADLARTIVGLKVGRAGETFTVDPFADEQLAEAS